mgnify:CR=1 FL=1
MLSFRKVTVLSLLALLCCVQQAQATPSLAERRQAAGKLLEQPCATYAVPKILALAIARQESGWHPWIINVAGKDVRPRNKAEAVRVARAALRAGKSFDVGLMQINSYWIKKYRWPLEQVLDPANNAKIGVWILAQEIRRHGLNWKAVAYYHTPLHKNPERGKAYAQAIVRHIASIRNNDH